MNKPVTILGGGAAATTMAADLSLRGIDVIFCEHPNYKKNIQNALDTGKIQISGLINGNPDIYKVTTKIKEAVKDVEIINVVLPALGHDSFFKEMIPHLRDGQIIVVWSGDAGSLRLAKLIKDITPERKVIIAETQSMPYGTRVVGPSQVKLLLTLKEIMMAALPANKTDFVVSKMKELFSNIAPGDNVLATSLSNPNPTVHPPGTLLSVSRIEYSKGDFCMYEEGITPSTAKVVKALYDETHAVAKALGFSILEYEDEDFRSKGNIMAKEFWAPFDKEGIIARIKGPSSLNDRYITEDLPYGLVHRSQLGNIVGVKTPVIDGIINLGSVVCDTDFWKGRTLEDLGLAGKSKEELMKYLQEGY